MAENGPGLDISEILTPSVYPELANADFAIVPRGFETGLRAKIPESSAYGVLIVTGRHEAEAAGIE